MARNSTRCGLIVGVLFASLMASLPADARHPDRCAGEVCDIACHEPADCVDRCGEACCRVGECVDMYCQWRANPDCPECEDHDECNIDGACEVSVEELAHSHSTALDAIVG